MTRDAQKERFLAVLAELGGSAGNGRLREGLGWAEATYAAVKAALVEDGRIVPGRGRGGSVALAEGHAPDGPAATASPAPAAGPAAHPQAPAAGAPPARTRGRRAAKAETEAAKGGDLGFETELFKAADKLRGNMEPSDYKHVALGLIFLKHISDTFEAHRAELLATEPEDAEDRDAYAEKNVFWVPPLARWSHLQASARQITIGRLIDEAMIAIEKDNPVLKGVLPKDYARPALNAVMLGELIDLISGIDLEQKKNAARDVLGRVYEYFLGQFAGSEGKRGGEFYTPRSVVRVMVEMIEPFGGRVYDPCCGSGGMFVQSERFMEDHGGRVGDIAVYGQESNYTTWRLCRMNLAVRGIDADIQWNSDGSFHKDALPDLKAHFILANPPFNISDWGGERLREDPRWAYGLPPSGNANFAWVQHIVHHLAPTGVAGVVLANGSMSSTQSGEGDIRRALVEGVGGAPGVVDCMVVLPGQLFYSTQIPACLWFLARDRSNGTAGRGKLRDRRDEVLFIDARKLGHMVDRTRRDLSDDEIARIADTYHAWRGEGGAYADVPGFCKAATLEEIRSHGHVLTPGRYVGAEEAEADDVPFTERFAKLRSELDTQLAQSAVLSAEISNLLARLAS